MKTGLPAFKGRYSPTPEIDRPLVQTTLQSLLSQSDETTLGYAPPSLGPVNSGQATTVRRGNPIGNTTIINRAHGGSGFTGAHRNGRF